MNKTTNNIAVTYSRVSDHKQVTQGHGLASQETRCREYAASRGLTVVESFKDDITGAVAERKGMEALLAFLRSHRQQGVTVIIDDVSRLGREREAYYKLRSAIASAGGKLESPSIKFGEDADSVFFESLMVSVAQHQRQKNAEQTKNRMRARVMNGYWVFQAPVGYRYERVSGRGMMMKRHEPVATIVQTALEGYASGRFENQADVMRFLQDHPMFPKDSTGVVRHNRVRVMLMNCLYAGCIEEPRWGVSMRTAQHEGLISVDTYQRIKTRMAGIGYAARKKNINADFPLRGFVECADCGTPLTGYWARAKYSDHAYYQCFKKGCESYGKSIRKADIEGAVERLLERVTPDAKLLGVAKSIFTKLWQKKADLAAQEQKALADELAKLDKQVAQLLDRVVDASVPSVIAAYEDKIRKLEEDKLLVREKMSSAGEPASTYEDTLRTALDFLANPWNLWKSGDLEQQKLVLKLTFSERLRFKRKEGLRTTNLSLPFKVLGDFFEGEKGMARPKRFELLTPRFVVWCSIQLSYGRAYR